MPPRRFAAAFATCVLALSGLAACGAEEEVHHGETEGIYVTSGHLKYQVQISRILNPTDAEDHDFLLGIPPGSATLAPTDDWFGVFLRAFNQTDAPHAAATTYAIHDTTGRVYQPVPIDPKSNPFVFQPRTVAPKGQLPLPDSAGQINTTQGGLVLFKIPATNFTNRPLTLTITSPTGNKADDAEVTLDV
jgi:hypothetical protein